MTGLFRASRKEDRILSTSAIRGDVYKRQTMCFNEDSYSDELRYEKEVIERLVSDYRRTKENRYGVLLAYYVEALLAATYDGPTRMEGCLLYTSRCV